MRDFLYYFSFFIIYFSSFNFHLSTSCTHWLSKTKNLPVLQAGMGMGVGIGVDVGAEVGAMVGVGVTSGPAGWTARGPATHIFQPLIENDAGSSLAALRFLRAVPMRLN